MKGVGDRRPRGQKLGDVLAEAGDAQVVRVQMEGHREHIETLWRATGKQEYRGLADQVQVDVSVAHLAHLPPETRVLIGIEVYYSEDEARLFPKGPPPPVN